MVMFNLSQVRSDYQEGFVGEVEGIFSSSFERLPALCGPENKRAFFRAAMQASENSGFALRGEIIKFSFLTLHLGLSFASDPLYDEMY